MKLPANIEEELKNILEKLLEKEFNEESLEEAMKELAVIVKKVLNGSGIEFTDEDLEKLVAEIKNKMEIVKNRLEKD